MTDLDEFTALVRDELGLPLREGDAERNLDELPGWDSMHLLWLIAVIERSFGRSVSLPDLLHASTLRQIHTLAVAG